MTNWLLHFYRGWHRNGNVFDVGKASGENQFLFSEVPIHVYGPELYIMVRGLSGV